MEKIDLTDVQIFSFDIDGIRVNLKKVDTSLIDICSTMRKEFNLGILFTDSVELELGVQEFEHHKKKRVQIGSLTYKTYSSVSVYTKGHFVLVKNDEIVSPKSYILEARKILKKDDRLKKKEARANKRKKPSTKSVTRVWYTNSDKFIESISKPQKTHRSWKKYRKTRYKLNTKVKE